MITLAILALPLVAALAAPLVGWRRHLGYVGLVADGAVLLGGAGLAAFDLHHAAPAALGGLLRADALSAFMVVVVGAVSTLAAWGSVRYLRHEVDHGSCTSRHALQYYVLTQVFVATMLLAVLAGNIGVLWIAVEATTITTTFLVGHRRSRQALEASWKYVVLCSVGIAFAFLGTVLVYLAAVHAGGHSLHVLEWTWLDGHARALNPAVMRLALGLLVLGFGTKVGLVPLHSWLPDAHGQAPAPVSALMSGVLLSVAFYALLRCKVFAVLCLGETYPRALFLVFALASILFAALLLVSQKDLKRSLAYSSTEHMGLLALGAAAGGPLAIAGVLLHVLGHGLAKGVLFLTSGEIGIAEGTTRLDGAGGLLFRRPALGGVAGFGLAALLGMPPFSLFVSEVTMMRGEADQHLGWAVAVSLVALAIAFAALASQGRQLLLGTRAPDAAATRTPASVAAPLVVGLAACAALGVFAWPLASVIHAAVKVATS